MKRFFDFLHRLNGCHGFVDREIDSRGVEWIGLRCVGCGEFKSPSLSGIQPTEAGRNELRAAGRFVPEPNPYLASEA